MTYVSIDFVNDVFHMLISKKNSIRSAFYSFDYLHPQTIGFFSYIERLRQYGMEKKIVIELLWEETWWNDTGLHKWSTWKSLKLAF